MRQMRQMGEQGLQKEREQDLEMEGVGETGVLFLQEAGEGCMVRITFLGTRIYFLCMS